MDNQPAPQPLAEVSQVLRGAEETSVNIITNLQVENEAIERAISKNQQVNSTLKKSASILNNWNRILKKA